MYTVPSIYLLCTIWYSSFTMQTAVLLDPHVGKYIQDLLNEFSRNPTSNTFDNIINPKIHGNDKESYFLPKIYIWCPITHYDLKLICPEHKTTLHTGLWTNLVETKSPRNPRLVYDLYGNVVLVQRFYSCRYGKHRYLSASPEILKIVPHLYSKGCFPFVILFRSAFSKQVVDFVTSQITQGVNFLQISEAIATLNFKDYCRRRDRYIMSFGIANNNINLPEHDFKVDNFFSDPLFAYPSNDLIMRVFLEDFQSKKRAYDSELGKTTASVLSFDHTFKVSKHIGIYGDDSKFVGQFSNLFVGLNENKEIVTWSLTRSTKFEHIENNLKELNQRLRKSGCTVKTIFVDDCCKVRGKYQSVFGVEQDVKLDLFHAVQRITSTLHKGTELSKKFANEFGLVFRDNADLGHTRNMPTPQPHAIEQNIENFERRWSDLLATPEYEKTRREIDKIKIHVRKGCLSGINPGEGTAMNENLHHFINRSLLCGASTIGPELAVAVLTVLFYTLNSKRKQHHHDRNSRTSVPVPIESVVHPVYDPMKFPVIDNHFANDETSFCQADAKRSEHIKSRAPNENKSSHESPLLLLCETIDDFCNADVAESIVKHSFEVYKILEQVNNTNKNRSFNVFHVPLLQIKGFHSFIYKEKSDLQLEDDMVKQNILVRNLSGLGLEAEVVEGDGNCCFVSIIRQLSHLISNLEAPAKETVQVYLRSLGLFLHESLGLDDAHILRQLFVDHVQEFMDEYATTLGMEHTDLLQETEHFRKSGFFNSDVGDIVVKACSEILNVAIVVVTSMDSMPYIPFLPARFCCDCPLYVAYSSSGLGHYNSTQPLSYPLGDGAITEPQEETTNYRLTRCTCGKNSKRKSDAVHCVQSDSTRCPCVVTGNMCDRDCICKGCQNKQEIIPVQPTMKVLTCSCGKSKKKSDPQYKACTDGIRKSKCRCLKNGWKCTNSCECYNCHNGTIQPPIQLKCCENQSGKRKRANPSPYKRMKGEKYLQNEMGQTPLQGAWTHLETFILVNILSLVSTAHLSPSISDITKLYNFIADYEYEKGKTNETPSQIRKKSVPQVSGKLLRIQEIQETNETLVKNF